MDLIEQICRKAGVRTSVPLSSKVQIAIHRIKASIKKILLNRIASQKESKRLGLARQLGHPLQGIPNESTIFVLPTAYRRDLHDFHNGKDFRGEFIVHSIIDELKKRDGKILCIDVDYTLRGETEKLKERLLEKDQSWAPLESFTTEKIRSASKRTTADVLINVRMLLRNPEFHRTLDYNGIKLWKTMQTHFEILLADQHIPSYARCIETAKKILTQLKPRSLFLPYETGPYAKSFIVASKELGITSIGIQHGIIYDKNPDYNHRTLDDGSNLGSPIPSIMLVFGDFSKQLLIGKSYPPERVIVVGHPEYEFDPNVLAADKRAIRQELGLDQSKEIILVATTKLQKRYDYEHYDVIMVNTLAKKLGNRIDIQIILKPHPLEDPAIYESIINEKAISNFLIRKDPIQRLILACDVFMTTMSTTAIEAIVLDRPVIVAQIPHNPLSFTLDGGAIGADLENLPDIALEVIKGEKDFVTELLQKRVEFKRRHFDFPNARTRKKVADLLLGS